jgi:hypothetical protein
MNINLLLNSQIFPFYQLNKYKETEKSVKEMEKSVKKTEKVENYSNITYSFNLGDIDIISNNFLLKEHKIIDYSSYFKLLEYMNKNKNSKVIFYYDKKYEHKLSYTKKILTFLNMEQEFEEIHDLIEEINYLIENIDIQYSESEIPEYLESYFDSEGKFNQLLFDKKVNDFKRKYFNDKDEIILNDGIEEFEEIEFIELPDIPTNQEEYIIFFLLRKLSNEYKKIPILYVEKFNLIESIIYFNLEEEYDLIFQNALSPIIFFKNIKKIDEILNFIIKEENLTFKKIFKKFFDEVKKENIFSKYYNYKK